MPKFRVKDSFVLPSRNLFVLSGDILEGTIRIGMKVDDSATATSALIHSIEFVTKNDGSDVALCIKCDDPSEAERLNGLNLKGHTLEISSV